MSAYYNEFDAKKAAWLRELISRGLIASGEVDERSIVNVQPDDLRGFTQCHFFAGIGIWSYALRLAKWEDSREVWTGSCPCQPFSAAGKGEAFDDERHLWPDLFRLIEARRPVVCFGEQVASVDGLTWLDTIQSDLGDADYACGAVDICAAGFGAPHRRQRLYWVADTEDGSETERLDNAASPRRNWAIEGSEGNPRDDARLRVPGERSTSGSMADADGPDSSTGRLQRSGELGQQPEDGRDVPLARGPVNGFWGDADWVLTRPQRVGDRPGLRPVERGAFPLAHGSPARVGRLRGYGDGIVVQAAQAFIEAYLSL